MTRPKHRWTFWAADMNGTWFQSLGSQFTDEQVAADLLVRFMRGWDIRVNPHTGIINLEGRGLRFRWVTKH